MGNTQKYCSGYSHRGRGKGVCTDHIIHLSHYCHYIVSSLIQMPVLYTANTRCLEKTTVSITIGVLKFFLDIIQIFVLYILFFLVKFCKYSCWSVVLFRIQNVGLNKRARKDGVFLGLEKLLSGISLQLCSRDIPGSSTASPCKIPSFPPLLLKLIYSISNRTFWCFSCILAMVHRISPTVEIQRGQIGWKT